MTGTMANITETKDKFEPQHICSSIGTLLQLIWKNNQTDNNKQDLVTSAKMTRFSHKTTIQVNLNKLNNMTKLVRVLAKLARKKRV